MRIQEIMSTKIEAISPDTPLWGAAQKMRDLNIGSLAVADKDKLLGIITDRDICCRAVAERLDVEETRVRDVMTKEVTYCFSDQDISEAAHLMEDKHIRRLAVFDRDKRMVGFLSVDDLAHSSHQLAGEVLDVVSHPAH